MSVSNEINDDIMRNTRGERLATVYDKLGGEDALKAAVGEMYKRLLADEVTAPFFLNYSVARLKQHQVKFMTMAFTHIPDDVDVPALIRDKHKQLFLEKGLNETHFDKVAGHFAGACQSLGVDQEVIDEAVGVIAPLRSIFEQEAIEPGTHHTNIAK